MAVDRATQKAALEAALAVARRAIKLVAETGCKATSPMTSDNWPGYDLRAIPGRDGAFAYGMLPQSLSERLRSEILARQRVLGRD